MNPDLIATQAIYNFVNSNQYTKHLPYYLGLLPYEMYVLPGMFIAMIQVILFSSFNPIPHIYVGPAHISKYQYEYEYQMLERVKKIRHNILYTTDWVRALTIYFKHINTYQQLNL